MNIVITEKGILSMRATRLALKNVIQGRYVTQTAALLRGRISGL